MLNNHLNFPAFDALEYTPELTFAYQKFAPLSPLQSGAVVTELSVADNNGNWHPYFNESLFNAADTSFRYIKKPLLLYFYAKEWGSAGVQHLKELNEARPELAIYGANVLVIHNESDEHISRIFWDNNISLEVYADVDHKVARLLGIYHENSPAWNTYAGIDLNIPLPAIYVLNQDRQIIFDFPNREIQNGLPLNNVKDAILQYAAHLDHKKSA